MSPEPRRLQSTKPATALNAVSSAWAFIVTTGDQNVDHRVVPVTVAVGQHVDSRRPAHPVLEQLSVTSDRPDPYGNRHLLTTQTVG